jgi:hypothetical protein
MATKPQRLPCGRFRAAAPSAAVCNRAPCKASWASLHYAGSKETNTRSSSSQAAGDSPGPGVKRGLGSTTKAPPFQKGRPGCRAASGGPRGGDPLCLASRSQLRRKSEPAREPRRESRGRRPERRRVRARGWRPELLRLCCLRPRRERPAPLCRQVWHPASKPCRRAVPLTPRPPPLTLLSSSIFTFFWEMLFWILLLKLALPAARPHRSPSSRRQHSCPGPGPAAPGGPAAETAPPLGTSAPAPAPFPFPVEAEAAAAAATTAATAAAASPPRLISSGVKPFMSRYSEARALTEIPLAPPPSARSPGHPPRRRQITLHPKFGGGTAQHEVTSACWSRSMLE